MNIFQILLDNEEEILEVWQTLLISSDSERYTAVDEEELSVRLRGILTNIINTVEGSLSSKARDFFFSLAQQRMMQGYNFQDLLTVLQTLRKAISNILGEKIFGNNIAEYDKVLSVLEEASYQFSVGCLEYQITVNEAMHKNLLELSTPVIPVDDNILVMPLIGTIDTFRADQIMETVLNAVTAQQAEIVIIDITGVPIVDSEVAHYLIRAVKAIKLVGAQCIMVGIRPEIAQTMVRLDLPFAEVYTALTLKKGLSIANSLFE